LTETSITEFPKAGVVVLGAPIYNFSLPSPHKPAIERALGELQLLSAEFD